jgi:membrane protein YqaA with SNARE-associated domain
LDFALVKNKKIKLCVIFYGICRKFFFTIPSDVLLISMIVAEPKKLVEKALICTSGSVFGAFLGYAIGKIFL